MCVWCFFFFLLLFLFFLDGGGGGAKRVFEDGGGRRTRTGDEERADGGWGELKSVGVENLQGRKIGKEGGGESSGILGGGGGGGAVGFREIVFGGRGERESPWIQKRGKQSVWWLGGGVGVGGLIRPGQGNMGRDNEFPK